jgi:catechol 2,3-dioxygenase-like lactoylglutathione lyase family enzyme
MNEPNPSIISHVSIGTNDFAAAVKFYDRVLASVGARRVMEHPGAVAYGKAYPEFWVQTPIDGKPAQVGNGTHIGFVAASKQAVDEFYRAALAAGATDDGAPGIRRAVLRLFRARSRRSQDRSRFLGFRTGVNAAVRIPATTGPRLLR